MAQSALVIGFSFCSILFQTAYLYCFIRDSWTNLSLPTALICAKSQDIEHLNYIWAMDFLSLFYKSALCPRILYTFALPGSSFSIIGQVRLGSVIITKSISILWFGIRISRRGDLFAGWINLEGQLLRLAHLGPVATIRFELAKPTASQHKE